MAPEEYILWTSGAGCNAVMDGVAAREEYYSALISWPKEDSISLEQELSTHMRKMLLRIPPTLMW